MAQNQADKFENNSIEGGDLKRPKPMGFIPENITLSYCIDGFSKMVQDNSLQQLLFLAYLRKNCTSLGYVRTSIQDILTEWDITVNRHPGGSIDQTRNLLKTMLNTYPMTCNADVMTITSTQLFEIRLNDFAEMFIQDKNFVVLNMREYRRICQSKYREKANLLAVYLCVKRDITRNQSTMERSYTVLNGFAISKMCGLNPSSVYSALKKLKEMEMIFGHYCFRRREDNVYIPTGTVYWLDKTLCINAQAILQATRKYPVYEYEAIMDMDDSEIYDYDDKHRMKKVSKGR